MSTFCNIQLQRKVRDHFQNSIKRMWIDRTKNALGKKKNFEIKYFVDKFFVVYILN